MTEFAKVKKVLNSERNAVLPLPSSNPSNTSPFPKVLPEGKTVELAHVTIKVGHDPSGVLLLANVNWSATFPGSAFTTGGWAEVTFEILRDGVVIYRVHPSAVQGENDGSTAPPALTVFRITALRHVDTTPVCDKTGKVTYTLRATNIIIVDPVGETATTTKANVGAVMLTVKQIEACTPK